jgi:2-polyprenyl-3-methyl-5-hydroxy-6-metoxy-1,4-benzoquinol methylase
MDQAPDRTEALEWTNQLVGKFWAHYAKHRPEDYFTYLFGDRLIAVTAPFLTPKATVLDYGCGSAFLLERLLRQHKAAGYDWSTENIGAAASRVGRHRNLLGLYAGERGERPKGQYDAVYFVETIEHVLEAQLTSTFAELSSLLAPGGTLIVTTPNDEDLQAQTVFCPCCERTFHRWQHLRSFTERSLRELMEQRGFSTHVVFTTDFSAKTPWQKLKTHLRPRLGRKNPHLVYVGKKI